MENSKYENLSVRPDAAALGKSVMVKSVASPLSSNKLQPVDPGAKSCVKSAANSTMLDGTQNARVMTTLEDEEDDDATSVTSTDTKKSSNRKKTPQDKDAKSKQKKKVLSIVNEVSSFIF
ncbi:hypothetical protein WR25_17442 [Diploscapter pachys]|uniref:Uncharacterized protein n=1 Tax=Diploscapter pachys TaxID=2018661 RepID=A0A2A2J6I2_9BILA|nr:hypothetical protein WR25_17442 [Diploscapter pachys]